MGNIIDKLNTEMKGMEEFIADMKKIGGGYPETYSNAYSYIRGIKKAIEIMNESQKEDSHE